MVVEGRVKVKSGKCFLGKNTYEKQDKDKGGNSGKDDQGLEKKLNG
jgi:hypothetical protein